MATVTPGALLKLLQSMNSSSSSDQQHHHHRSPVLQVTGISPASSDLNPSSGFYLHLSDSVHSTYAFLSDPDASDSLHLGQLVHVSRLLPSRPVPILSGLRPIPFLGRSPPPILGSPQPLSVSFPSPSNPSSFLIHPSNPDSAPPPVAVGPPHTVPENNEIAAAVPTIPKRRSYSPAVVRRDPSPAAKGKGGSRASSPVPSKCVVPSLAVAREENRKVAREPAIVVPSRYRQPSPPVGGRRGSSPMGRRGSVSPGGRRLSGGGEGSNGGGGKKKVGVVVAGISRASDALVGSGRSVRKSWEENSGGTSEGKQKEKEKGVGKSKVHQQAILRTQVTNCNLVGFVLDCMG